MKKNIVVIMGGKSSEHDVSLVSASTVVKYINKEQFDVILVGITKEGKWLLIDSMDSVKDGSWVHGETRAYINPDVDSKELMLIKDSMMKIVKIDVVFPVLHGMNGEDGTIQGLFELAHIPYVGCGVLASACSMDKFYTKIIVNSIGVRQAKFVGVRKTDADRLEKIADRVEAELGGYPVFVKPSKAGSSQGVNKAVDRASLIEDILIALQHDSKVLVEEMIVGRELECAVLGNIDVKASGIGEVLAADEFYSYEAKYNNADSKTVVDPVLPEGKAEEIREKAVKIFTALDGAGLSRVDFFLTDDTHEVVFNEINTLPGFTAISMYPMLWEARGIDKEELIQKLIDLAMVRYDEC